MLTRVNKPALIKRLFEMGCAYSGKIMAYTKMLGQLVDAGNTTTLAHYLAHACIPQGSRTRPRTPSWKLRYSLGGIFDG